MDLPLFGDHPGKRRREINLGGYTTATSQSSLLEDAKERRRLRDVQRKKEQSATRIQSWWRGRRHAREVRSQLRAAFEQNVANITGLRCLVLIGKDEALLAEWAKVMLSDNAGALGTHRVLVPVPILTIVVISAPLVQASADPTWSISIRKVAVLLLKSVSDNPL